MSASDSLKVFLPFFKTFFYAHHFFLTIMSSTVSGRKTLQISVFFSPLSFVF